MTEDEAMTQVQTWVTPPEVGHEADWGGEEELYLIAHHYNVQFRMATLDGAGQVLFHPMGPVGAQVVDGVVAYTGNHWVAAVMGEAV